MAEIIFVFICIIPAIFVCLLQFFIFRNVKGKLFKLLPLLIVFITFIILSIYEYVAEASLTITWVIEWFIPGCLFGIILALISRKIKISYIFLTLLSLYTLFMVFYNIWAPAQVFHEPFSVEYNDELYVEYDETNYTPYSLEYDDTYDGKGTKIYVKHFFYPFEYFEPYCTILDKEWNFIWLREYDRVFVKESFVFPTIDNNEVEAVWMSASSSDEDNITDKKIVDKIVECIKSNGKSELDKEIVDYIKKYSWDNHCFSLKYKNCPIIEQYHICKNEDGKYIIEQFTEEEYHSIYFDDEAHYNHWCKQEY